MKPICTRDNFKLSESKTMYEPTERTVYERTGSLDGCSVRDVVNEIFIRTVGLTGDTKADTVFMKIGRKSRTRREEALYELYYSAPHLRDFTLCELVVELHKRAVIDRPIT